jgi:hypothetical protein
MVLVAALSQASPPLGPLAMRDFRLQFDPAGMFTLSGEGWPSMAGRWTINGSEITLVNQSGPADCAAPADTPSASKAPASGSMSSPTIASRGA